MKIETLAVEIIEFLKENNLTLSSAESCTGGRFADAIISFPGTSAVFDRALVTYSNQAKMDELGVKAETLEKYGAVSEQTACEMAEGLYRASKSDICVSVTGIAGPDGGTLEKPVGLVYTAIRFDDKTICKENRFENNGRDAIRNNSVFIMLDMINNVKGEIL